MSKINTQPTLTQIKKRYTPPLPQGLSIAAERLFRAAVNKITYSQTKEGGWAISYERLSEEELFAIGISGIDEWPFMPESVGKKLQDMQPMLPLGNTGLTIRHQAIDPNLVRAITVAREADRKEVLVKLHGEKFKPGRDEGSITDATSYIQQLVKSNPNLSAKKLRDISDKSIIGNMLAATFGNKVSAARNQYPKEKKAAK